MIKPTVVPTGRRGMTPTLTQADLDDIAATVSANSSGSSDGGEAGNLSDAEIKLAYESNADTNAFTDTEQTKLAGLSNGGGVGMTDAEVKIAYENNTDTNVFDDAAVAKLLDTVTGPHTEVSDTVSETSATKAASSSRVKALEDAPSGGGGGGNDKAISTYASVADMIADAANLSDGDVVETSTYWGGVRPGRRGGNTYRIKARLAVSTVPIHDGGQWVSIAPLLDAEGLFLDEQVNVQQFGAHITNATFDAATYIQKAINYMTTIGGDLLFPRGAYPMHTGVIADFTNIAGNLNDGRKRINFIGEGKNNTQLYATVDGITVFTVLGGINPGGGFTAGSHTFSIFQGFGVACANFPAGPGGRGVTGILLQDCPVTTLRDVSATNCKYGLHIRGLLQGGVQNSAFAGNDYNIYSEQYGSGVNAVYMNNTAITGAYYVGIRCLGTHANFALSDCNLEANGLANTDNSGGIYMSGLSGGQGEVGLSITNTYFENNRAGFDVKMDNFTGSKGQTVRFTSVNFNRTSLDLPIALDIDGPLDILMQSCSVTTYQQNPTSTKQPYRLTGGATLTDGGGNRFGVGNRPHADKVVPWAGYVDLSSQSNPIITADSNLPLGWEVQWLSLGRCRITHNLGHTDYSVVAGTQEVTNTLDWQSLPVIKDKGANSFEVFAVWSSRNPIFHFSLAEIGAKQVLPTQSFFLGNIVATTGVTQQPATNIGVTKDGGNWEMVRSDGLVRNQTSGSVSSGFTSLDTLTEFRTVNAGDVMTELDLIGGRWEFDIFDLPRTLLKFQCWHPTTVEEKLVGAVLSFPFLCEVIRVGAGSISNASGMSELHGAITDISLYCKQFQVLGNSTIGGDFATLNKPNLSIIQLGSLNTAIWSEENTEWTGAKAMRVFSVSNANWDTAMVDRALVALADPSITWTQGLRQVSLNAVGAGIPTAAGLTAKATLEAQGVTVEVNS